VLIFPTEAADAHLSGSLHDGDVENLAADFLVRGFALLLGEIEKSLIGDGFDVAVSQHAVSGETDEARGWSRFRGRAPGFPYRGRRHWGKWRDRVHERAAGDGFGRRARSGCRECGSVRRVRLWPTRNSVTWERRRRPGSDGIRGRTARYTAGLVHR